MDLIRSRHICRIKSRPASNCFSSRSPIFIDVDEIKTWRFEKSGKNNGNKVEYNFFQTKTKQTLVTLSVNGPSPRKFFISNIFIYAQRKSSRIVKLFGSGELITLYDR